MMDIGYDEKGFVPVVVQEYYSKSVLMLAYANEEAVRRTVETKKAHYFSRSRNTLWMKGETSGNTQEVRDIFYDCDCDALMYVVVQTGSPCHTGNSTCFYRRLTDMGNDADVQDNDCGYSLLKELFNVITDRKSNPKEGSYTNYLFSKGIDKILKKIGEESAETIIAAKNNNTNEIAAETADLIYHILVMLADRGMTPNDVYKELRSRR